MLKLLVKDLRRMLEGRGYPVGTKRRWTDGQTYVKAADGTWVPEGEGGEKPKDDDSGLTDTEKEFLRLMSKKTSDKKVRDALKLDQGAALKLAQGIRAKLKMTPMDSFRDAAKKLGLK
jgi:hypothetical protein